MSIAEVSKYAYSNAKVRGMKSRMLLPEKRELLLSQENCGQLLHSLQGASAPEAGGATGKGDEHLVLARLLTGGLRQSYWKIWESLDYFTRGMVRNLAQSHELDELKLILRGINAGMDRKDLESAIQPWVELSRLPYHDLLAATDLRAAMEALRNSSWAPALDYPVVKKEGLSQLFILEAALDRTYYMRLWRTMKGWQFREAAIIKKVLGPRIDIFNIMWALRAKHYFNLPPEDIAEILIPTTYFLTPEMLRELAYTGLEGLSGVLAGSFYAPLLTSLDNPPLQEVLLKRRLAGMARASLAGYPFHLGVMVSFLLLKEMEANDLNSIYEALYFKVPRERLEKVLVCG